MRALEIFELTCMNAEIGLPKHIAIIPDGNRRWAKQRGLPSFFGHREGAKTTEKILVAALKAGIPFLTFWGASISNVTNRDEKEVHFLSKLFEKYFAKIAKAKYIHENKVNIQVAGRWKEYFPKATKEAIVRAIAATKDYHDFQLTILLAYSGTEEMVSAISALVSQASGAHKAAVSEAAIKNHLYTKNLPPVDLAIRTGGEPHLSAGFMMWDMADAQLFFSDLLWPDFSEKELSKAIASFQKTERRLGK